jgi:hypothetical protein
MVASREGHLDVAKWLIEKGANIEDRVRNVGWG